MKVGLVSDEQSPMVPSSDEIMLGRRHGHQATPTPGQWAWGLDLAKLLAVTNLALHGSVLWEALPHPRSAPATAEWRAGDSAFREAVRP